MEIKTNIDIKTRLKSWNKKTISKSELESLLHTGSDAQLCGLVSDAVSLGYLSPVKSSGTNGNRVYPVYLKYRVVVVEDYSDELSEISILHPSMIKNGYLQSKPELYAKYRIQMQHINQYLFKKTLKTAVSKKERSFDIFGNEKQLDNAALRSLLDHMGLTSAILDYYETPEYCFNDYIPERKAHMVLLILENKDIWFNVRRRMYEDGVREIFDTHIDGAVYGCGNRVSEKGALSEYTHFMGAETVRYLYWGDIDRAGLNIYLSLVKNNPDLDISLFAAAYEEMIRISENRRIPDSDDHRELTCNYEEIYSMFSDNGKERLVKLIEHNKRLPQEIINYGTLLKVMR